MFAWYNISKLQTTESLQVDFCCFWYRYKPDKKLPSDSDFIYCEFIFSFSISV